MKEEKIQGNIKWITYNNLRFRIEKVNDETDSKIKSFYGNYISLEKDIDKKLFYEKLDEANNYDFDKAIINIKNENIQIFYSVKTFTKLVKRTSRLIE